VGEFGMPFSFSGSKKLLAKTGEDTSTFWSTMKAAGRHPRDVFLGQMGFQPAASYIQSSPALNKAREYEFANRPPGTRTQEQAAHREAMASVQQMYRTGKINRDTISQYIAQGKIQNKDVAKAQTMSKIDPLAWATFGLSLEQALNVYAEADEKERKILRPIILKKHGDINKIQDPDRRMEVWKSYMNVVQPPKSASQVTEKPAQVY